MNCPNWIYEICIARVASEYLSSELDIVAFAKKYSEGLAISYNPIPIEAFSEPTEQIIIFLAEIEAGENAVELLENFTYFRLYFEALNVPRKLKTVFGNIEDPVKQPLEPKENTRKALRAYIFGLRSNTVPTRPAGWLLEKDENIPKLAELVAKPVTPTWPKDCLERFVPDIQYRVAQQAFANYQLFQDVAHSLPAA